jgi:hypothetical protein
MALPSDVTEDLNTAPLRGRQTRAQLNNLIADVRVLRTALAALAAAYNTALAKLDADGGVTDTNYVATGAVVTTTYAADTTLTAAKVVRA